MSKTFFITGGAGLIGSNIVRKLLPGNRVIIFDAFVQYISPLESQYQSYLEHRFNYAHENMTIVRGDTRNKFEVSRTIHKYKPDIIIHLAAMPIADLSYSHSEEALDSIIHGTVNVLETIKDVDYVERFVYTSSSMVYGDFQTMRAREDHPKCPKEIYGGTKYAGEILTQTFSRRYGIKYSIVRPSAVYGPSDVNKRVSQIFIENALNKKPLLLHGQGQLALDFTFVEDIADGFILAATHKNAENEIFNMTRGEGRTLLEYVEVLRKYIQDIEIRFIEKEQFRPRRGALDISKAQDLLGYNPKYSLEQGLKKYLEFFITHLSDQFNLTPKEVEHTKASLKENSIG